MGLSDFDVGYKFKHGLNQQASNPKQENTYGVDRKLREITYLLNRALKLLQEVNKLTKEGD